MKRAKAKAVRLGVSPELRALALRAVNTCRQPDDIEAWARQLAEDSVAAGEIGLRVERIEPRKGKR